MQAKCGYFPTRARVLFAVVLTAFVMALGAPLSGQAAGMQQGGGQQGGDEVRDQLRLRDGSCQDAVVSLIFEADMEGDRLRLRDGSCDDGCDGEPDRDRIRLGQD